MALVIEDGTIVANATSFASRSEIIAYAAARGVTLPDDSTTDVKAVSAGDFFWTLPLRGAIVEDDQSMPFPRYGLVEGDENDGFEYEIPSVVKRAQMQLTIDVHQGVDLAPSGAAEAGVKKKKAGPVEKEFFDAPDPSNNPRLTIAMALLEPYLISGGAFSLTTRRV